MIFLTVGTHEPFSRLIRAVDDWSAMTGRTDIFGQIAALRDDNPPPQNFEWVERLAPVDFGARFDAARLIVSHAGMGTIISALSAGKPVVVLPRRGHLNETRNDHQWATAQHLAERRGIHVAWSEDDIGGAIEAAEADIEALDGPLMSPFAGTDFTNALRGIIAPGHAPHDGSRNG